MGRHASVEGARPHPLVAEALERRAVPVPRGTHRGEPNVTAPQPTTSSSVGWPAAPTRGDGLGWPGEPDTTPVGDDGSLLAALDAAADPTPDEVPAPRRGGWRRFFGGGHSSTTSAA